MPMADRSKLTFYLLLAPLLLWLVTLIILPHVGMFIVSLREKVGVREYETSFANYAVFFNEPLYWNTFARTAYMSVASTVLTLLIGFPIAYYIAKLTRGRSKTTLFLMCLIPFWVSELVRTFGWMILLRETGIFSSLLQYVGLADAPVEMLYNDAAIMVGLVYTSMLFMVVPLVTTLLRHKARTDVRNSDGQTALTLAQSKEQTDAIVEVVRLLQAAEADARHGVDDLVARVPFEGQDEA